MSLGYPIPDLVIGLDSGGGDDDAAVIAFGFAAASVVEDDDVEAVSLFAVALGGGVAFVCGDPAVKLEARLSEELPDERSLGGGELLFGSLPPASTVTLISTELDLLLVASLTTCLLLPLTTWPPLAGAEEESSLPFPAGKMPPLAAGRTWPVSAPIRLHVLASIASGLDLESSWKRGMDDVPYMSINHVA